MKKLLSAAMALVMGLSMASPVLAEGAVKEDPTDWSEIKIEKEIKLENEGTVSPAEEFQFTVTKSEAVDTHGEDIDLEKVPVIDSFSINFVKDSNDEDSEKNEEGNPIASKNIELPAVTDFPGLGVYTYEIKESIPEDKEKTAGMSYDDKNYLLVVKVINGPSGLIRVVTLTTEDNVKRDAFENKFYAGDLKVKKDVTGNFANTEDVFEVEVTLTSDKNIKEGPIKVVGSDDVKEEPKKNEDGSVTVRFSIKGNQTVTLQNVPYDVSYEVKETDQNGYTLESIVDEKGDINKKDSGTVVITNSLNEEINTGINLDNLPYILVLALVGVGLISFTVRKRVTNE